MGSRSLLADGTVSYAAQPMAGGASALFRFVPGGEGRSVLVAGYSESGQVNVCVLRGAGDTQGRPQSGVFFSLPDLDALWNQPGYRTYLNTALTDGLEPCTLTRLR